MDFGSARPLAIAMLCSAIALGACRTSPRDETAALARLSPVSAAAASDATTAVPALTLAVSVPGAAQAYRRAVARAAISYEFAQQSCESLARDARASCRKAAFERFADARAKAHAARMSAVAAR